MRCILCLKKPNESIALYGEQGLHLDIKSIINKHFWLQPSEEDTNFNIICSLCWKSLQSFNNFYDEIERTHRLLNKVSFVPKDNSQDGGESNGYLLDDNDDILYPGIKIEFNDGSSIKPIESFDENIKFPMEIEVKPDQIEFLGDETGPDDSDSEIPLSKLTEQLKHNEESLETSYSTNDKNTKEEKIHINEGKWLATCFGEETVTKPISHEELDKFIKLNMQLTCEICRISLTDFSALQTHFKDAHTVKPFITCCDKKFELRCRLVDHILLHKFPNYFTCVVCSKVLSCRLNLRKHMVVHDKKQVFQCDQCEKTFYRKEVFNRHVLDIHTLERKFKCEECDKLFASKCSLNTHIYGVHKGRYKKICEQCGKVSCDQETFLRHQLKHTNQPITYFECPKCSVKLSSKHGLRHHIRYQHSEDTREHTCNVCGNVSTSEAALKRHITYMHKYKRDFKCSLCEKAFKRALTLKPSEEDTNFNIICSPCWESLQSFHKFYKEIERTHRSLNKISPAPGVNSEGGGESNSCLLDNLYPGIQMEFNDNTNPLDIDSLYKNVKCPLGTKEDQIEAQTDKVEDSDSEIPLSKLTKNLQYEEKSLENNISTKTIKKDKHTSKEGKIHIQEGIWLATCYGEETVTKHVRHDELDKFIKLNTQLTCEICCIPMKNFLELQIHFRDAHDVKAFVTCCDKKLEFRSRLVDHILMHKFPNYFTCVVCSKVFSCRLNLNKHMVVHGEKQVFQCDQCEKSFCRKEVFNRHVLDIHTLKRKFQCEECDKFFASKCSMNAHIYVVHKGRYKRICELCGKASRDKESFLRHQLKHTNQPVTYFDCPKCSVKLSSKHGLSSHLRLQHSEDTREHPCNVCGTKWSSEVALKRHITYMHKNNRAFKCTLCEKAFKKALILKICVIGQKLFVVPKIKAYTYTNKKKTIGLI